MQLYYHKKGIYTGPIKEACTECKMRPKGLVHYNCIGTGIYRGSNEYFIFGTKCIITHLKILPLSKDRSWFLYFLGVPPN
jgi:hypothetical protein